MRGVTERATASRKFSCSLQVGPITSACHNPCSCGRENLVQVHVVQIECRTKDDLEVLEQLRRSPRKNVCSQYMDTCQSHAGSGATRYGVNPWRCFLGECSSGPDTAGNEFASLRCYPDDLQLSAWVSHSYCIAVKRAKHGLSAGGTEVGGDVIVHDVHNLKGSAGVRRRHRYAPWLSPRDSRRRGKQRLD